MRIFLAIEFDMETKAALALVQGKIRPFCVNGNFSREENLHLTVKFIGDTQKLDEICKIADDAARGISPFNIELKELGAFNKGGRNIFWTGVNGGNELKRMHIAAQNGLIACGIINTREDYRPHITLVREARLNCGLDDALRTIITPDLFFKVTGISVMESTRVAGKLTYLRRHFAPFKGEDSL